jgi:dTDP-4-dehydrorhamnose reductase
MRVAVIGCQGQLGSDLVRVLRDTGNYDVTPLSHAQLDITNREIVQQTIPENGFDVVVNCAGFTRVEDCEDMPAEALLVNAQGAFEVARACARARALCVHISTDYVFSGEKGSPYVEDDLIGPVNVYGVSKLGGELLVRQATEHWLIVRISSVFGKAGSRGKGGNFVEAMITKARSESTIQVVNDIWMSPTYTLDAARTINELIQSGVRGLFHASNGGRCTWFDFASEALRMAGLAARVEPVSANSYPTKARRPRDSSLNTERLEKTLAFSSRPWREALRAYLGEKGHLKSQRHA